MTFICERKNSDHENVKMRKESHREKNLKISHSDENQLYNHETFVFFLILFLFCFVFVDFNSTVVDNF